MLWVTQQDQWHFIQIFPGRREAQYNGLWSVMTKFTVIPSMSIPLAILAVYGYQPNVAQSDTVVFVIRAIFGLAPAMTSIIAFGIAMRYPISQAVHEKIWQGIEAHKRGESAVDPLTDKLLPPPFERGVSEDNGWFLDHFSSRELRRYLARGAGTVVTSSLLAAIFSGLLCIGGAWNTVILASDLTSEPGITAVLSVLVSGVSFAAFCFHVMRVRAARHLGTAEIDPGQVAAHLAFTNFVKGGNAPLAADLPVVESR